MRRENTHAQMTRRAALTGALLAPALPALALPARALDADPHPEWLALWRVACAAVNTGPLDCDDHPLWGQYEDLTARIMETPATTMAGVAAQLTLLAEEEAFEISDAATHALRRAAAVLGQI